MSIAIALHIDDAPHRLAADIDAFVETLRQRHRPARAETELARGFLLQGRGGEGRLRVALDLTTLDLADGEAGGSLDRIRCRPRLGFAAEREFIELLAVEMGEAGGGFLPRLGTGGDPDRPIFARV